MTSVPVFIQPDSEQDCLLGSNVLPALGISVVRANGHPLIASSKVLGQNETVGVNLVQATTLPGLNGCFAKAKIDMTGLEDACLLFEPDHKALGDSGVIVYKYWRSCTVCLDMTSLLLCISIGALVPFAWI